MSPTVRLTLSAAVFLTAVFGINAAQAADSFAVSLKTIEDRKAVFATVESVDTVMARARIGGTVNSLSVDEGSKVDAGQKIADVDDPKLRIEMAAVDARISSLQAQLKLANTDYQRAQKLRKSGAASEARLDESRTGLDVAERSLAAMQAERAVIVQRRNEGAILAPVAGRVLKVHITDGSVIMPGEPVATIAQETYILRMHLPERHARFLSIGDRVLVGARGLDAPGMDQSGLTEGRVLLVYPELSQGRVVADIEVDGLGDFFVGERTRVYVSTGTRDAYVIPPDFVFHRFGLAYVKLENGGEAVVVPGLPVEGGVEILSG
ncbi:MAG: efflux RND transporter periplasmic adaptor subunit, partial [Rhodospirillales bacterium]|nr:efflux RND transporter periplasmic adaptor subunit [Rhodospirillales bacterium]